MELSLRFITKKLGLICRRAPEVLGDGSARFSTARYADRNRFVSPKPGWLVVCDDEDGDRNLIENAPGLVWINEAEPPAGKPAIWIRERIDALHVLNYLLDMFDLMNSWSTHVQQLLLRKESIDNVVQTLSEVTNNPFYYCDASFRTITIRDDQALITSSDIYRYQVHHGRHPVEAIASMMKSGDLERMNKRRDAWLFEDSATYRIPFVSKTVFCHGSVFGHIFVIETNSSQSVCDIDVLEELGNLITLFVEHHYRAYPASGRHHEQTLKDLLSGKKLDREEVDSLLTLFTWEGDDPLQVLAFELEQTREARDTGNVQVQVIEGALPAKALVFGSCVVSILNRSEARGVRDLDQLESLCKQFGWNAGVSDVFENIERIEPYCEQAFAALQIGSKSKPDETLHHYHTYLLPHLRASLMSQMEDPLLQHCDVITLERHDEETGSSLAKTLYSYLRNERIMSKTSAELFMHRNFVMYRIEKIKQLIVSDLDDPDNRLALLISLEVAKAKKEASDRRP